MNLFVTFFCFQILFSGPGPKIYDVQLQTLDGATFHLSSFKGKKILVTTFNPANPDISQLLYLDSLQRTYTGLRVIAVPAIDFSGAGNRSNLLTLKNSLNLRLVLSEQYNVKKTSGSNQHNLFKWLTRVSHNSHFDVDVETAGQVFIVNRNGVLYSVLGSGVPRSVISEVVSNPIGNEQ